jgi:acyl carrier protein phosphodiesterase
MAKEEGKLHWLLHQKLTADVLASFVRGPPPAGLPPGFCTDKTRQAVCSTASSPESEKARKGFGAANQRRGIDLARLCVSREVRPDDSAASALIPNAG